MSATRGTGFKVVWGLVVVLAVIHWDFWFWDLPEPPEPGGEGEADGSPGSLLFDFLPIGLLYHALFSLAAACVWAAALKYCWPHEVEAWAERGEGDGGAAG